MLKTPVHTIHHSEMFSSVATLDSHSCGFHSQDCILPMPIPPPRVDPSPSNFVEYYHQMRKWAEDRTLEELKEGYTRWQVQANLAALRGESSPMGDKWEWYYDRYVELPIVNARIESRIPKSWWPVKEEESAVPAASAPAASAPAGSASSKRRRTTQ